MLVTGSAAEGNAMIGCDYVVAMAGYNEWMNAKLYAAAEGLSDNELAMERNAFFGSIIGTLNHIVVGDTIWLKRFATHPSAHGSLGPVRTLPDPAALDHCEFWNLNEMGERRKMLDAVIQNWAAEMSEADLSHVLEYRNMKGESFRKWFAGLLVSFFNHQTHHRGQATTLLSQAGIDVGATDFHTRLPNLPAT